MKLIVAALGAALLLSGCTASPAPAPRKPAEPLTAAEALGDFATVDFCSLLDERGVTGTGAATPPTRTFDTCTLAMSEKDTDTIVHIGSLSTDTQRAKDETPYDYRGELPAGIVVEQAAPAADGCTRYVVFSDDVRIKVVASAGTKPGTPEARCAKADAAVTGILHVVSERRVGHVSFAENSFGKVKPCDIVQTDEANKLFEWDERPASPITLTKHGCRKAYVDVNLDIGAPAAPVKAATTVAGKRLAKTDTDGVCTLRLEHPAPGEPGRVESIIFSAYLSTVDKQAYQTAHAEPSCHEAEVVAGYVLPKLPA